MKANGWLASVVIGLLMIAAALLCVNKKTYEDLKRQGLL